MKNKLFKTIRNIIFSALLLFIGFKFAGIIYYRTDDANIRKIKDVYHYLKTYYYKDFDDSLASVNAINGLFENLDPHSIYISREEQMNVTEEFEGNFIGIGIEFQIIQDTIVVVSPISGGPSESLGILSGDRIISIDSQSSIGYTNSDVLRHLRGKKGSIVKIGIYRPSLRKIIPYSITRQEISIYSVDTYFMIDDTTAYLKLSRFAETSYQEISDALNDLTNQGMKKLIFDLRGNPGGLLNQAVDITDLFLEQKKLIVYTKGRISTFDEEYYSSIKSKYENLPLIILINRGSASASEIFSGAIKDHERGKIVGERSFGKGLVQRPFLLEDNSAVRITISEYFNPSGRKIQRNYENKDAYYDEINHRSQKDSNVVGGVIPDIYVSPNPLSENLSKLMSLNLFYRFIREEFDNKEISFKGKNVDGFINNYKINNRFLNKFLRFAKSSISKTKLILNNEEKKMIKIRLKAYIAREFWKNEGWYKVFLTEDEYIRMAKKLN